MNKFDICLKHVLGSEGGYSDREADHGGSTMQGVTQKTYDEYRKRKALPQQPVKFVTSDEVREIYKLNYWIAGKCHLLPNHLDLVHFDGCVNHGVTQAAKFLQRALCVADDGFIGPLTLGAVNEENDSGQTHLIVKDILEQRKEFYKNLVEKNHSQKVFLKGWVNRIDNLTKTVNMGK